MSLTPYTPKAMHHDQSYYYEPTYAHTYTSPPPSYTTSVPRSRGPGRRSRSSRPGDTNTISTKRLFIRGVQLMSLLLCVYRLWDKHANQNPDGEDRNADGGTRQRSRSSATERQRTERNREPQYGDVYGSATRYGNDESDYVGGRRRRRREREMESRTSF